MSSVSLPGEATLLESWRALGRTSPGAHVRETVASVAAIFPAWDPLNNAIARVPVDDARATTAAVSNLDAGYARAGVTSWAYWVPSAARDLGADDSGVVTGLVRDVTTLVMRAELHDGRAESATVRVASILDAAAAGDEPIAVAELDEPTEAVGLDAWVLVRGGHAVAGAWSCVYDGDCGIYAVGTAPEWRRRGFARTLVEHALADAHQRGARTASLQSTPMAVTLYESLGFEAVGRYEEWVREPGRASA